MEAQRNREEYDSSVTSLHRYVSSKHITAHVIHGYFPLGVDLARVHAGVQLNPRTRIRKIACSVTDTDRDRFALSSSRTYAI
jgi:hypothetical protein